MPDAIGVIGAGLIGASILARASAVWPAARILAFERSTAHRDQIAKLFPKVEIVAEAAELRACDLVFVCTPVQAISDYVRLLLDGDAARKPVVVDTGSVKRAVADEITARLKDPSNYVPGHPLAGSHLSGPSAASPELIDGRAFILTPTEATSETALAIARSALEALGAKVVLSTPSLHDEILALTSHLPHVIAYALVEEFCAAADRSASDVSGLVAGSFKAQTVFAGSDPEMWADILIANAAAMSAAIDGFARRLAEFKALAIAGDKQAIMEKIAAIRDRRKTIGD